MATPLWHCPSHHEPDRTSRPNGPWCDDQPCQGHRAGKPVRDCADVVAWTWGYDGVGGVPEQWRQVAFDTAAVCLADLGRL